jgi:hypothetical protein
MITFIVNFFESLVIAVECNDLARSGDWKKIREILNVPEDTGVAA